MFKSSGEFLLITSLMLYSNAILQSSFNECRQYFVSNYLSENQKQILVFFFQHNDCYSFLGSFRRIGDSLWKLLLEVLLVFYKGCRKLAGLQIQSYSPHFIKYQDMIVKSMISLFQQHVMDSEQILTRLITWIINV